MANCCVNREDLGCYECSLTSFDTGLVATQTGNHKIRVWFGNMVVIQTVSINATENIIIPNNYNENRVLEITIENPDGSTFTNNGNDCFTIRTVIDK